MAAAGVLSEANGRASDQGTGVLAKMFREGTESIGTLRFELDALCGSWAFHLTPASALKLPQ
jgi:hypothetical protein